VLFCQYLVHYIMASKFLDVCKHLYQMQMNTQKGLETQIIFTYALSEVTNKYNNVKIQIEDI